MFTFDVGKVTFLKVEENINVFKQVLRLPKLIFTLSL
jgi:hypothetical protein